jgi:hypothetical protein
MKEFIINTFKISLFIVILYSPLVYLLGKFYPETEKTNVRYKLGSYGHLYTRLKEVKKYENIDILFIGSSHTCRGFDNRIFKQANFSSFNLGSASQTPIQSHILLKEYINQLKPKTIIYEVWPGNFTKDGIESSIDILSNKKLNHYSLELVLETLNFKTINTFIFAFIANNLLNFNNYSEKTNTKGDKYIPGGFVEKEISYYRNTVQPKIEWKYKTKQLNAFQKSIQLIKEKNINLILVYAPVTKAEYLSYTDRENYNKKMKAKATYYNYNEIISVDDSLHFFDNHHLNQNGVILFNTHLSKLLQNKLAKP